MVETTAFQNDSCQRVTCDSKLAVESERFEKRQLRLPQSKCRTHRRRMSLTLKRSRFVLVPIGAGDFGVREFIPAFFAFAFAAECDSQLSDEQNKPRRQ